MEEPETLRTERAVPSRSRVRPRRREGDPVIERLAWVTTRGARGLDKDEPIARRALSEVGVSVEVVDWDDPTVDWAAFDRVVLRSAWDYTRRLSQFSDRRAVQPRGEQACHPARSPVDRRVVRPGDEYLSRPHG